MDTVKINRISPFKEWLAQRKLNEGGQSRQKCKC